MTDKIKPAAGGNCLRILRDNHGNIMPMAAIAMVAMAGMVGGGVDMSRAYMVQNRLQNACDAGALAGRAAVASNGFDSSAQAQAAAFFNTNFDEAGEGTTSTSFTPVTPDNGNTINGSASTVLDTVVMQLFGYDSIPLSVNCTASMAIGNSDVMMVLDTTGSMAWDLSGQTRMAALQGAMKGFYDTVAASSAGGNARIRYGFVPYSSTVNVGTLLNSVDTDYLADSMTIQSREAQYIETEVEEFSGWGDPEYSSENVNSNFSNGPWSDYQGSYPTRDDCNNSRPSNSSWSNVGGTTETTSEFINGDGEQVVTTTTIQPQERTVYGCYRKSRDNFWIRTRQRTRDRATHEYAVSQPVYTTTTTTEFDRYVYKAVDYDTSSFKGFNSVSTITGTDGASQSTTWQGCIEERATVAQDTFSWSSILGYDPSGARDLDIDSAPDSSDADTQWKPMWSQISYYRTTDSSGSYYTNNAESDYGFQLSNYCPVQAQLLDGMTESEFDTYADSLSPTGATYHNLGFTWGARLLSPDGIFQSNVTAAPSNGGAVASHLIFMTDGSMSPHVGVHSAYGIEIHDQRVTDDGSSEHADRHSARFLAVCAATKAKGIRVWVIAFASALTDNLIQCASTDSSFLAANSSQLNNAFQEIAKDVGELRITQ